MVCILNPAHHLFLYIKFYWTTAIFITLHIVCSCFQLQRQSLAAETHWTATNPKIFTIFLQKSSANSWLRERCNSEINHLSCFTLLVFLMCCQVLQHFFKKRIKGHLCCLFISIRWTQLKIKNSQFYAHDIEKKMTEEDVLYLSEEIWRWIQRNSCTQLYCDRKFDFDNQNLRLWLFRWQHAQ